MGWKCPDCGELYWGNDFIRCTCGYEINEEEDIEDIDEPVTSKEQSILSVYIFLWQFIPAIIIFIGQEWAFMFLVFLGGILFWSPVGLFLAIKKESSYKLAAIVINVLGLIFWVSAFGWIHFGSDWSM